MMMAVDVLHLLSLFVSVGGICHRFNVGDHITHIDIRKAEIRHPHRWKFLQQLAHDRCVLRTNGAWISDITLNPSPISSAGQIDEIGPNLCSVTDRVTRGADPFEESFTRQPDRRIRARC
jgi:hypothetical protein